MCVYIYTYIYTHTHTYHNYGIKPPVDYPVFLG